MNQEKELLTTAIVSLNRLKRKKVDGVDLEQTNDLQRHLEEVLGRSAIELDEVYNSNGDS